MSSLEEEMYLKEPEKQNSGTINEEPKIAYTESDLREFCLICMQTPSSTILNRNK